MWKHQFVYDYGICSVIVTLGGQLYRVAEVVLTTTISLISKKQCQKVISQTDKFILFMIQLEGGQKVSGNSTT